MTTNPPTPQQRRLAAQLGAANVDAAEYLAQAMAEEARQRKRVRGFAIEIRWNAVTGLAELRGPEAPAKGAR